MMDGMDQNLVQAILVSKAGSHEEMIEAVARASLKAYREGEGERWREWLAGRFTKSVRRSGRDLAEVQRQIGGVLVKVGFATALAMTPMRYEEMPKLLREAQVQGTNRPRGGAWPADEQGLRLTVNGDLDMSTGKAAAQVAHGLLAWWLQASEGERQHWQDQGEGLWILEVSQPTMAMMHGHVSIHDAGLTEIEAGSLTVKVQGLPAAVRQAAGPVI